ncbi:MAG: ribosome maturation factor RimP [Pseudomonadota bacterium]|nr:ribosome maturation factor RimP [Pseudomonadota bacterium]
MAARVGWRQAIEASVSGLGYQLVDVERGQRGLLRITIDRIAGRTYGTRMVAQTGGDEAAPVGEDSEFVNVEDCEQVTRQLQYVLQVEGLDYARLEVSSPGLDRPLRAEADLQRFVGAEISIVLKEAFEGRKVWQGVLGQADGGNWQLTFSEGAKKALRKEQGVERVLGFRMDEVREARLVPVVDFKGRKTGERAQDGASQAGPAEGSQQVAGRSGTHRADTDGG